MKLHELKTHPEVFAVIKDGLKPWEIRKDDRGFEVGDVGRLREWDPRLYIGAQKEDHVHPDYTGRELWRRVIYILRGPAYGVPEGYVILTLEQLGLCGGKLYVGDGDGNDDRGFGPLVGHWDGSKLTLDPR